MRIDLNVPVIAISDVITTLLDCSGCDWHVDDALAFASDLTGISIDSIWELMEEETKRRSTATVNQERKDEPVNTRLEYVYRDGGNNKKWQSVIVKGTLTETQKKEILDSLFDGYQFIPEQVGLPCDRLDEYERNGDDLCFCEMSKDAFTETSDLVTEELEGLTAEELHKRFVAAKGKWDLLKYSF